MIKKEKIVFKSCKKAFREDLDKASKPEDTLKRFYRQIKNLDFNLVNEVKRIDNGRLGIPVYFSVCSEHASRVTGTRKQMGKGTSAVQAETSACMELVERFSFFHFKSQKDNFIEGDYHQLQEAGYPVLDVSYLLQSVHDEKTSPEQLLNLLEGIPLQWTWATNITEEKLVLVPFTWFYTINEFNGPSAGNTPEEAVLQGICELIERDVCSRISSGEIKTPSIDPEIDNG